MILFQPDTYKSNIPRETAHVVVSGGVSTFDGPSVWLETDFPAGCEAENAFISLMSAKSFAGAYVRNIGCKADMEKCGHLLGVAEAQANLTERSLGVLAVISTAGGVLSLDAALKGVTRLRALVFDAGSIAWTLEISDTSPTITQSAVTMALSAHNAGAPAIWRCGKESVRSFRETAEFACRLGFSGIVATTPQQFDQARAVFG